jgi:hypothetical protein
MPKNTKVNFFDISPLTFSALERAAGFRVFLNQGAKTMSNYSTITDCRFQARKIAIALNNAGIVFLHRQQYTQAMETFRDAMLVMKIAASIAGCNDIDLDKCSQELGHFSEIASSIVCITNNSDTSDSTETHKSSQVNIVPTTADDSDAALSLLTSTHSSTRLVLPLSINPFIENVANIEGGHFYDCNVELESCTLIRNFGLAHACLACQHAGSRLESQNLSKSYRLFKLARTVVKRLQENDACTGLSEHALLIELLLGYDLLHTSIQLELDLFEIIENHESYQAVIFWLLSRGKIINDGCKSAPAA